MQCQLGFISKPFIKRTVKNQLMFCCYSHYLSNFQKWIRVLDLISFKYLSPTFLTIKPTNERVRGKGRDVTQSYDKSTNSHRDIKMQRGNTQTPPKTSITQQFRTKCIPNATTPWSFRNVRVYFETISKFDKFTWICCCRCCMLSGDAYSLHVPDLTLDYIVLCIMMFAAVPTRMFVILRCNFTLTPNNFEDTNTCIKVE